MIITPNDDRFMQLALRLAERGLGDVWPNPAVGCVIVDAKGRIVGRGWTQSGGRPHAETEALARAGAQARGAAAYVSLEPCAHVGQTGPCAQALIDAGVARVVSALEDPDPRVAGQGHAMLKAAGIALTTGVGARQAARVNAGFLSRVARGRPLVTLKLATTLDGKIALASGESRWITGESARHAAHILRSSHDAVMVGIGTALKDDPELTVRVAGIERPRLVRIVADADARLPVRSKLAASARDTPVWLLCAHDADTQRVTALAAQGVEILRVARAPNGIDLAEAFAATASKGLTRILVEGGATLAADLVRARLYDRLALFRAPVLMGAGGIGAIGDLSLTRIADMPRLSPEMSLRLGQDVLETYAVAT